MKKVSAQTVSVLLASLFMFFPITASVYASAITTIHEINTSPARFDGKEVILRGITKDPTRIPIIDLKGYALKDNTGEVIILTEADLPEMGIEITVRVRIDSLAIINGEALGTTVVELQRYDHL